MPRTDWMLQPLLAVIPLQLLAYRIARLRGSTSTSRATWPRPSRSSTPPSGAAPGGPRPHRPLRRRAPPPPRAAGGRVRRGAARPRQPSAARFCAKEAVSKALALEAGAPARDRGRRRPGAPRPVCAARRGRPRGRARRRGARVARPRGATAARAAAPWRCWPRGRPAGWGRCPTPSGCARSTAGRSRSKGSRRSSSWSAPGGPGARVAERARRAGRRRVRQGQQRRRRARRGALLREAGREVDVLCARPTRVDARRRQGEARAPARRRRRAVRAPSALDGAPIVDALLGTGFSGEPREPPDEAIAAIERRAARRSSPPTSPAASTPRPARWPRPAVRAVATATFAAAKPGLWINPGKAHAGEVAS